MAHWLSKAASPQAYEVGGVTSQVWLQNAGLIWIPFILLATLGAAFGQNNLRGVQETYAEKTAIFGRKHAWVLGWLYTGTFGSFIGFAAAFPILLCRFVPGIRGSEMGVDRTVGRCIDPAAWRLAV